MAAAERGEDFAGFVDAHLPALHRCAARLVGVNEADDVVQEALVRAWRRRSTYDAARGEPLPWLLAIVRDRARRHRSRSHPQLALVEGDRAAMLEPADLDLERAMSKLSPRQREVVDLYYVVDLDVATVAAVMGCATGTVRATLHQARAALRELLGEDHD